MRRRAVVCCSTSRDDAGYATPLAMAMCIAISLSVSALMTSATSDLQLARRDLDREKAEYALDGQQTLAAIAIAQSRGGSRLLWNQTENGRTSEVVADAELQKLAYAPAAEMDAAVLQAMEVADSTALRGRLRSATEPAPPDKSLPGLDAAALWKLCAPALLSRYGAANELAPIRFADPGDAVSAAASRAGELWRVRIANDGWVDERIVRFTGNPKRLAAVVERRFFRGEKVGSRCDVVFSATTKAG